jgi:hypothetical protein
MSISSSANGTYTDCGLGQGVSLTITCGGPSCGILAQFPHLACTNDPSTAALNCNNGVMCPQPVNFLSQFDMQQYLNNTVSAQQLLQIDGQMFAGSDNGQGTVSYAPLMNAVSSTTSKASTSTTRVGGGAGGSGGNTVGTETTLITASVNTGSPSVSAFVSSASTRRPSLSKTLFALYLIFAIFIGQTTAYTSFPKNTALSTGLSLLWFLASLPHVTAQCTTIGAVPVSPISYSY